MEKKILEGIGSIAFIAALLWFGFRTVEFLFISSHSAQYLAALAAIIIGLLVYAIYILHLVWDDVIDTYNLVEGETEIDDGQDVQGPEGSKEAWLSQAV